MTSKLRYSAESLLRIESQGDKPILAFFKLVDHTALRVITKTLAPIAGFRPGTPAAHERQLHGLAQRLAQGRLGKSSKSKDEYGLYSIWRAFAHTRLTPTPITKALFDKLDDDQPAETEDGARLQATIEAFGKYVRSGESARDDLMKFATMSPFADVRELLSIAGQAKTEEEAREAAELRALPTRLRQDEGLLKELQERLTEAEAKISAKADKAATDQFAAIGVQIRTLEAEVAKIAATVARLEDERPVQQEAITIAGRTAATAAEGFQRISAELGDAVKALAKKVDDSETSILDVMDQISKPSKPPDSLPAQTPSKIESPPSRTHWVKTTAFANARPVDAVALIVDALSGSLVNQGLLKSQAESFAAELLAAIAARQCVFLKGAFAGEVVSACVRVLSAGLEVTIPVRFGADDLEQSNYVRLWEDADFKEAVAVCITLENLNSAPIGSASALINSFLRPTSDQGQPFVAVFGTLLDSPAAFPLEKLYLQLGPVFDLDVFDWRAKRGKPGPATSLSRDAVNALTSLKPVKSDDEEARRLAGRALSRRDPKFERNVTEAIGVLSAVRRDTADATAIQSICFGWVIPYWLLKRPKQEDVDADIDGGKCDSEKPDIRLKRLLSDYGDGDADARRT